MKVLIACEFSGVVRDEFNKLGHDVWSCDLLPTERAGNHIQGDVLKVLNNGWDLMIAHPPCTYLTVSANKWMKPEYADRFPNRANQRQEAIDFFLALYNSPIPKLAIENPIGIMSTILRKPDQIIQPWMFGYLETKATCFWLKNLPKLIPTTNLKEEIKKLPENKVMRLHYLPPSKDRWKERSRTYPNIAEQMAIQWGKE
jgi:hypothetical protein